MTERRPGDLSGGYAHHLAPKRSVDRRFRSTSSSALIGRIERAAQDDARLFLRRASRSALIPVILAFAPGRLLADESQTKLIVHRLDGKIATDADIT